jgi:Transposase DDE domain
MAQSTRFSVARQLRHLRDSLAQQPGLPFADLLPDDTHEVLGSTHEPLYTPLITLGMFLSQVLDAAGSCQAAVARLLAWLTATGQPACSARTGAYCKARQRLPEAGLRSLMRRAGTTLSRGADPRWLWKGRPVRIADGTTLTMPDTPENQKEYPQPDGQKPGLGFPMIRLVVIFCLATGAVLEAALCPYRGKGTGEISLLRQVWDQFETGDVLLGDRIYCSYLEIALLGRRGVDVVLHKHQSRRTDFRTGTRLGRNDHRIAWAKPARPDWMTEDVYRSLPETLEVREVRVVVACPGFRVKSYEVITTLRDPESVAVAELGELYRRRWEAELNLRSLKSVLGLDQLRCKTPEMVRKELWVHMLAYNLVRGVMSQAACVASVPPGSLSFTSAVRTLLAFAGVLSREVEAGRAEGWDRFWCAVATHRVGDRPGRAEPRAIKRRKKNFPLLNEPRKLAQQRLLREK